MGTGTETRLIEIILVLAMIFALLGLLTSALQEAFTSATSMRGRLLQRAIVSFVGDDPAFAAVLQQHPLIVSQAQGTASAPRRPSYLQADVVVSSLLHTLSQQATQGARPARPAELVQAVEQALKIAGDGAAAPGVQGLPTARFVEGLSALVQGVEDDWAAYESRVAAWYESVMQRCAGWFKRRTQLGTFVIGFAIAAAFNIDPITIVPALWVDDGARSALAQAAGVVTAAYAKAEPAPGAAPTATPSSETSNGASSPVLPPLNPVAAGPVNCEGIASASAHDLCARLEDLHALGASGLPIGWTPAVLQRLFARPCPPRADTASPLPSACGIATAPGTLALAWLFTLIGWAVCGIAATFGAPFWFDLLTRFVALRGSGAQASSPAAAASPAPATAPNASGVQGQGVLARSAPQ